MNNHDIRNLLGKRWRLTTWTTAIISAGLAGVASAGDCSPHWDHTIGQPGPAICGSTTCPVPANILSLAIFDNGSGNDPQVIMSGGFDWIGTVEGFKNISSWDGTSWSKIGTGLSEQARSMLVWDDGTGPALYVAGQFITADGVSAPRVAKWDGNTWSTLGDGVNGIVYDIAVFDDGSGPALYATGGFTMAGSTPVNRIAKWDGTSWSPLGSGLGAFAAADGRALAVFDDGNGPKLYVGGNFTAAGGLVGNHYVTRWNGVAWETLPGPMPNLAVETLKVFDDGSGQALYVGGNFTTVGGLTANRIARFDGTSWSTLGTGVNNIVRVIESFDDGEGPQLYAGGSFTTASGMPVNRLARWNGSTWSKVGGADASGQIWSLLPVANDPWLGRPVLYVGGGFLQISGTNVKGISRWVGCATKQPVSADLNGDGVVNVSDLLILFGAWGNCPRSTMCPADLNNDGVVNVSDLLLLLSNWG